MSAHFTSLRQVEAGAGSSVAVIASGKIQKDHVPTAPYCYCSGCLHSWRCKLRILNKYDKMKATVLLIVVSSFLLLPCTFAMAVEDLPIASGGWKAGIARVVITPEKQMWLAGYGFRKRPSEGALHDLWAKALVVEDAGGKQAVLITADLLGVPKHVSDRIRMRLEAKHNLSKAQIIINSSHTHTGPVLENSLPDIYALTEEQLKTVEHYTRKLEEQLINLVGVALNAMVPVQLYAANGVTRFQVNRRNNRESELKQLTELKGPNDYAVPVIKVVNEAGDIMAVAFGYACHPTVLSSYEWSGDYAGFAQLELEKKYPGAMALFFQGAGADQNPLPRRTVALAQQYGQTLAAAVVRVLNEEMRQLAPTLTTAYSELALQLVNPPTEEELLRMSKESSGTEQRWASRLHAQIKRGEPLLTTYPYPLQVWQLGDQLLISLGGELVVEYAIRLKQIYGQETFVLGYSNDVMSYIPSAVILKEGGYEGASSQRTYGLPGLWAADIETKILEGVKQLTERAGVVKPKTKALKN